MTLSGKQASHLPQLPEPGEKNICSDDQIPDISKVFERFYRVDKSHSKSSGGTGLGLSIVKHAVQYHHGKLELKSEIGKGTEITVHFPIEADK